MRQALEVGPGNGIYRLLCRVQGGVVASCRSGLDLARASLPIPMALFGFLSGRGRYERC